MDRYLEVGQYPLSTHRVCGSFDLEDDYETTRHIKLKIVHAHGFNEPVGRITHSLTHDRTNYHGIHLLMRDKNGHSYPSVDAVIEDVKSRYGDMPVKWRQKNW